MECCQTLQKKRVREEEGERERNSMEDKKKKKKEEKVRHLDGTVETCLWNFRGCISSSFFLKTYDDVNN